MFSVIHIYWFHLIVYVLPISLFYSETVYCWPSTIVFLSNFPFISQFWLHVFKLFGMSQFIIHSWISSFFSIGFLWCFLHWILFCLTRNIALSYFHFLTLCPIVLFLTFLCKNASCKQHMVNFYLFIFLLNLVVNFIRVTIYWEVFYYVPRTMPRNFLYTSSHLILRTNPRRWPYYHYLEMKKLRFREVA